MIRVTMLAIAIRKMLKVSRRSWGEGQITMPPIIFHIFRYEKRNMFTQLCHWLGQLRLQVMQSARTNSQENVTKKCNCKDIRARNRINQFLCQEKEDGYFSMEKDINVEFGPLGTECQEDEGYSENNRSMYKPEEISISHLAFFVSH